MKSDAWMPLYAGDYLRDTGHLTAAEHGAYLLLLMQAWTRGGALPADDDKLRMLARMERREWDGARATVLAFFTRDGDAYRNARLDREIARREAVSDARRRSGARGAAKRWQGDGAGDRNAMADAMANATQEPSQGDGQPQPQPPLVSLPSEARPARPDRRALDAEIGRRFAAFYAAYPRHDGKIAAEKAYRRALQRATADEIDVGLAGYRFSADPQFIPLPATWLNQGRWESRGHAPPAAAPAGRLDWVRDELFGATPDTVIDGEIA